MNQRMIFALTIAVGVIAANLYYAQPLVALIAKSLNIAPEASGLVVTLTQLGYGFGVLLIVPLGDIIESRRLVLLMLGITVCGLAGLSFSQSAAPYFLAAFATGLGASSAQVVIPFAASLVPEAKRGHLIGTLMSGLMIGIMLSRPVSGILSDLFSWHAVFIFSAVLVTLIGFMLYFLMPPKVPEASRLSYSHLLHSMGRLYLTLSPLRRRAFYQACLFGAFSLFWTAIPLYLAGPQFALSQSAIALFALVGVSGAIAAPFAGKAADGGYIWKGTFYAMLISALSFLLVHLFTPGSHWALIALVLSAILLDAGITANLVLGQRVIFSLSQDSRSRINGLYMATIFVGGALGSALGAWAYVTGGWWLTSWVGFAMPVCALLVFLTEEKKLR